ncbi:hypothetical protein [Aeromonas salmonicida]|uniref:hypothetical protein n=1 Tax=Aeromonas salmonicida TaxID=645 RepID=UPI00111288B3|nr:hypothetical protein [Aeromonas salmonicida]MDE7527583.1 hypothetical protein [Aeromonas salmonicida]MDE7531932.1 hypothetical protein [Aeromonas salmonicida]
MGIFDIFDSRSAKQIALTRNTNTQILAIIAYRRGPHINGCPISVHAARVELKERDVSEKKAMSMANNDNVFSEFWRPDLIGRGRHEY